MKYIAGTVLAIGSSNISILGSNKVIYTVDLKTNRYIKQSDINSGDIVWVVYKDLGGFTNEVVMVFKYNKNNEKEVLGYIK
jgi:hypothetical protein